MATAALTGSSHLGVTDNQKRWLVAGIALNKILIPQIRLFVQQGINTEYNKLKTSHNIHGQSSSGRLQRWPARRLLKYENINGNDVHRRLPDGRLNYSLFDCRVTSDVDFARLYVENYMAKFTAFDDHCDASAVLSLLGGVPVFSASIQIAAGDVRKARNDWAHCVFSKWDPAKFQQSFIEMDQLVRNITLPHSDEKKLLGELNDWETRGTQLCMNSPVDPALLQLVQQEVKSLQDSVDNMSLEFEAEKVKINHELGNIAISLEEMNQRLHGLETGQQTLKYRADLADGRMDEFEDAFGPVADFIDVIRQLYKDREGWLSPFPWCEEFGFHLDNIFTRLKMVSRKKERGVKTDSIVNMLEIFKPHEEHSQPKRVLIEGQPGMGKTTYCNKVAYDWAKKCKAEDSFPDFQVLLLLKCRDITSDLWEAIDDQLLPKDIKEEEREKFFTFVRDHQSKVLLVLDGLDELPSDYLPFYKEIIEGRMLPNCYLVVTARHEAGIKVRKCCHTLLELEGFTEDAAEDFIVRYFKTDEHLAKKLLDKLCTDASLSGLTANPLNTALLCLLWEDFQGDLPKRRTLLYHEIVQCVLRRYRKKKELPKTDEDLTQLYHAELKHLGSIAWNGLLNDEMYFDDSAFRNGTSNLIPELEFLSAQAGRSKRRPSCCYGFLHKSFQEFFATLYLSCQLVDEEIYPDGLLAGARYEEFQQVLMFTCGMVAQRSEAKAMALMASIASQINQSNGEESDDYLVTALNCIKESENEQGTFGKELARSLGSLLEICILRPRKIGDSGTAILAHVMKTNPTVTALDLCFNKIGDSGAAELAKAVEINSTLTDLWLAANTISDSGVAALAKAVESNSTLTNLSLACNEIGDSGAAALAKAVEVNSTLTELNLSGNEIGDSGAAALAKAVEINSTLTTLDLSENEIGDSGAAALAKAVEINSTLTKLHLVRNRIGALGATALA
ncbi:NLR family CARD domain-containing protein 3-like isoform X2 [Montipora foliosa]|uniref:NLR family CARD domain-containing protein 3-like isoform X2 n=1 Tax=Montipora foliosa TaxID=591990 RepID=UPI0035F0FB14